MSKEETISWLLTHAGVESDYNRELIYNTLVLPNEIKFNEALEVIDNLLGTISWLGGDSYEMEATAKSTNAGYEFLQQHRLASPTPPLDLVVEYGIHHQRELNRYGLRCEEGCENRQEVYARKKIEAARKFRVSKAEVIA